MTSSTDSRRCGSQTPTHRVAPGGIVSSDIDGAERKLAKGGMKLLTWQYDVLCDWLSRDEDGDWAAGTCGLSVPRQNGKTALVVARCVWGMLAYGEWVVYTSHLQKTSTETFEEVKAFFERPSMARYVKEVRSALGREEIKLEEGGRIKFLARTRNSGRGQHGDLLIFDEAQEVDDTAQAALLPSISASRNPQTIYLGTPPDEAASGEVFTRIRADALSGRSGRISWNEWSVERFSATTNGDVELWAKTNPSLGHLIREQTISDEHAQFAPAKFARERLGWWGLEKTVDRPIAEDVWSKCRIACAPPEGILCYGVKFSPDNASVSLSVCVKPKDGSPSFIECIEHRSMVHGIGWLVDWLTERRDRAAQIVVDGKAGAQTLIERLVENGVSQRAVIAPSTRDVIAANSSLLNAVKERTVCHAGQPGLTASATLTTRRKIGTDGGWGFNSTDEGDATLIESCALAYWAAQTTKRDPTRRAIVW